MPAAATDYYQKVGRSTATTLSAPGYTIGNTSINVGSTTNWPTTTGVTFAIDTIDSNGLRVAGTYNTFRGTVNTATQITNVTYVGGDANQNYSAGSTTRVYILAQSDWANRMVDGILVSHDQDGTLKAGAVDVTAVVADAIITRAKLASAYATEVTTGWLSGDLPAISSVTANGNRSYDITFASTVASILSSGMRLRTTRTVAAPTQCTSLNGSTQYYSKASPNKLTFTDDFVCSAWIKLTSYTGAVQTIASRYNGTSGWTFRIGTAGQVEIVGYNAGASNFSFAQSYQSVPLNKWVHVTAQLDMSTFTATTTTSYIMLDGKDVPTLVSRGGTNPTALIQAGNLEIGSLNGGTLPFGGKIAQVAIYNAKVTQATILASINQGLSGTETSLASAYSFNNAITDLNTTTPNDLTANGSAVATNADSPFGNAGTSSTLDYALVQAISTTVATVQVPEGCTIPTSGGVTSVAYSVQGNPYGWVSDKGRWELLTVMKALAQIAGPVASTWYNPSSVQLSIPVGTWIYGYTGKFDVDRAAASPINIFSTLSTSNSSETNTLMTACSSNGALASLTNNVTISSSTSLSAATPHYLNILTSAASITNIYITGSQAATKITALPSGL